MPRKKGKRNPPKRQKRIYLDNCATTPVAPEVMRVMTEKTKHLFGNPSSHHCIGKESHRIVHRCRVSMARRLGCDPDELVFTSGSTESNNMIVQGCMRKCHDEGSVLYSPLEHPSVFNPIRFLDRHHPNIMIEHIQVFPNGRLDVCHLEYLMKKYDELGVQVQLVCVILANHEIGTLQDLPSIVKAVRKHSKLTWIHSDITQAVGKMPIDLHALGIDSTSFSSHKFNGPKAVGGLYVRKAKQKGLAQLTFGGNQEMKMRPGTENVQGIVGMCAALELATKRNYDMRHAWDLRQQLLDHLGSHEDELPRYQVQGGRFVMPGTLSLSFDGVDAEKLIRWLSCTHNICISRGAACKSGTKSGSNVLQAVEPSESLRKGTIRVGIGRYNTPAHMRKLGKLLVEYMSKRSKVRPKASKKK